MRTGECCIIIGILVRRFRGVYAGCVAPREEVETPKLARSPEASVVVLYDHVFSTIYTYQHLPENVAVANVLSAISLA